MASVTVVIARFDPLLSDPGELAAAWRMIRRAVAPRFVSSALPNLILRCAAKRSPKDEGGERQAARPIILNLSKARLRLRLSTSG
ncbi:MAG: hypothetical protein H0T75_09575 [Rhizobiales bacterium]|nr:hypothetical protein [Hyphomicrobiales bacterium]